MLNTSSNPLYQQVNLIDDLNETVDDILFKTCSLLSLFHLS